MKRLAAIMLIVGLLVVLFMIEQNQIPAAKTASAHSKTVERKTVSYQPGINTALQTKSKDFYRFFRDDCVKTITVVISPEEWKGMSQDMQRYSSIDQSMRTGNYRKADIVFEDKDGKVTLKDVGIRTKGNTTRIIPQDLSGYHRAHFKIKFDETFKLDPNSDEYKKLSEREFMGLDAINLKANLWNDESFVHEKYAYELLEKAGAKVPEISMTVLRLQIGDKTVNYGVYTMIEPVDAKFLKKRYGDKSGNLYKCLWQSYGPATLEPIKMQAAVGVKDWTRNYRPSYDLKTNKDQPDHTALLEFIDKLNALSGNELKAYLDENFEVDSFLKYMACNMLLGMPDDYWAMGNNYYLYFNPLGKIEFLPFDYDQCLASGWDGSDFGGHEGIANANILEWRNLAQIFTGSRVRHPLVEKVLSIEAYKQKYFGYLKAYTAPENNMFSYANYKGMFDYIYKLYGPYMKNDTVDGSVMKITDEQWYMETKIKSVNEQLSKLMK